VSPPSARIPRPPRIRRPASTIFDAYVAVDWSARNGSSGVAPRRDAVWASEARWEGDALRWEEERYFPTRRGCIEHLVAALSRHLCAARKVLVGFDFPLGYPAGFARALGLERPSWRATWRLLRDPRAHLRGAPENRYATADNRNDRFAVAAALNRAAGGDRAVPGPFHGCPARHECAWLARRRPEFPFAARRRVALAYWRRAESRLRGDGRAPLSAWWVLGGGPPTVGGQALVGIPAVQEIAERLRDRARVWPFETGFTAAPAGTRRGGRAVLAEIWPGLVAGTLLAGLVRDAAQVRAVAAWAAASDAGGALGALFDRPAALSAEELDACTDEEGWILGVR
jgi:hypothetical protein